ncbi:hypothetical protein EST38_g2381 [Candolleomyces aberdarensis]|uniref:Uncharacterized protein n=1 Tax=Candolleomyces aberdarensis TaxID=2316362 RepID=A0A4Q2DWX3_9AGAR|nr:hypothetical protein EST38_g2381 [Candolleomyces aberdarensis]
MNADTTSANSVPEDSGKKDQADRAPPPLEEAKHSESLHESEKGNRTMESGDFDTTIVAGDTTLQNASLHVKSKSTDSSASPHIFSIAQGLSGIDQTASDPQPQQHASAQQDVNESYAGDITIIAEEHPTEEGGEGEEAKRPSSSTEDNNSSAAKAPSVSPRSQQQARPPAKNLQLNIKPPSPQPWDLVSPAEDRDENNGRVVKIGLSVPPSVGGYSSGTQNFGAMQSAVGNGRPLVPKSSYYFGPPGPDSAYGTPPVGQIGVHHPREILRIERDYTGGEVIQFAPIYPLELENRAGPLEELYGFMDIFARGGVAGEEMIGVP